MKDYVDNDKVLMACIGCEFAQNCTMTMQEYEKWDGWCSLANRLADGFQPKEQDAAQ